MPIFREFVYLGLILYIPEAFVDFNGCYQFLRSHSASHIAILEFPLEL